MPVRIAEAIPQQNFEAISLFIASQLLLELDNQKVLQGFEEDFGVFLERGTSVDARESDVVLSVLFSSMNLDSKTQFDAMYIGSYFIDVYTSGKADPTTSGDRVTGLLLMKYLGLCRYIFESHKLKDSIPPDLRLNMSVISINTLDPTNNQDANFSRMGRLVLEIKFVESQDVFLGVLLDNNFTNIKLQDTEDGYQLILN